ncbi:MAG TPA: hypothetical protein VIT65_04270 [Microlunatus sp.]
MRDFGPWEFQLMLLRRMADFQPGLVSAALNEMGATRAQQRAAHHRWQQLVRSARFDHGIPGIRAALGPPESDAERDTSYGPVRVQRWRLPSLWPDLRWSVLSGLTGTVLRSELVRFRAREPALPSSTSPPAPWSLVVADTAARLAHHRDDTITSRTVLWLPSRDRDSLRLTFVWGLLQEAVPADPPAVAAPGA